MSTTPPETTADPARGGYFTVADRRPTRLGDREDFHVKGFDWRDNLLVHTWHTGEHSMQMEVRAWLNRGALPRGNEAERAAMVVREQDARMEETLEARRNARP